MNQFCDRLSEELSGKLSAKRYAHSVGVAYTAVSIAMAHGYKQLEQVMIAGLLHDCAKVHLDSEMLTYCQKYDIDVTPLEERNPQLLHAKLGEYYAKTLYQITDEEICQAIRFHTTGRPGMNFLEKCIFIADYIEPHRKINTNPPLDELRQNSFRDINLALPPILSAIISYLKNADREIDEMTLITLQYYNGNQH